MDKNELESEWLRMNDLLYVGVEKNEMEWKKDEISGIRMWEGVGEKEKEWKRVKENGKK